jgi:chromosome transmission fidelity protein 4
VAAATDRRQLRIFSVNGFQREVISLPGPIVALAGQGPYLAAAVHLGMPLPGNQVSFDLGNFEPNLNCIIYM